MTINGTFIGRAKIPLSAVLEAYDRLGNVHAVGESLGVSHSAVHRAVKKHRPSCRVNVFTEEENTIIREHYAPDNCAVFDLSALSSALGRDVATVCGQAKKLGLTNQGRKPGQVRLLAIRRAAQSRDPTRPHPRGMAGKQHSAETKARIAETSRAAWQEMKASGTGNMSPANLQKLSDRTSARWATTPASSSPYSRAKQGKREDIGIFVRSSWEANYARYLNWLQANGEIDEWSYEPETFWFHSIKRGVRSYKPDFRITEKGRVYFVEVKGWMDAKSATKLKRMKKYYPDVEIRVVGPKEYRAIKTTVGQIVAGWE